MLHPRQEKITDPQIKTARKRLYERMLKPFQTTEITALKSGDQWVSSKNGIARIMEDHVHELADCEIDDLWDEPEGGTHYLAPQGNPSASDTTTAPHKSEDSTKHTTNQCLKQKRNRPAKTTQEQPIPDLISPEATNLAITRNVIWQLTSNDLIKELQGLDFIEGHLPELQSRLFHRVQNDPKILSALLDKYEPQKRKAQDQVRTAREKEVLTPKTITALPSAMLQEHLIQRGLYTKAFGKKQALISALQESCQPSQRPTTPQEQHTPDLTSLETTNLAVTRNVIWQLTKLDLTGELKSHRDPTIGNAIELKTRLFHKMQNDQETQIKLKQKYPKETKNALKQVQEARKKQTLTKKEIKALRQSMLQEHLIQRGLHTKAAGTKAAMARALQDFYYPPKTPVG